MRCLCLLLIASHLAAANVTPTSETDTGEAQTNETAPPSKSTWYCPDGWDGYTDGEEFKCVYFSDATTNFYNLRESCRKQNAKPVEVFTENKNKFLLERAARNSEEYILPLVKTRGYGLPFVWEPSNVVAENYFISSAIASESANFKEKCVYISGYSFDWDVDSCDYNYLFICEKNVDCLPGTFGPACESECHCAGEPCDTRLGPPTCKWGCEQGWTGTSCSRAKEHPEVRYFCIKSPDEHIGSYVGIHIYTKGVDYRSIYAMKRNSSEPSSWCPGTTVSRKDGTHEHVDITMVMNETVMDEIRRENCAGQEIASNQFEWTLVIQEYEGILLDTDLQVVISCDFNASESLQRSADYGRSDSHDVVAEKVELAPETADVTLEVVDPFTEQVITEAAVGDPAKLQIKFGYQSGSLVKGACPHHCVATTPDNSLVKNLLDHNGCPNKDSPIQPFSSDNTTNSISTVWFPLFSFAGHDQVEFKCSFDLCFSTTDCHPGCNDHKHHKHRHRRAAGASVWPRERHTQTHNVAWRSSVIRILPQYPDQVEDVSVNKPDSSKPEVKTTHIHHNNGHDSNIIKGDDQQQQQQQQQQQLGHDHTTNGPTTTPSSSNFEIYTLLNPITYGLLLLLLVVLSALFLAFHFSLRKNVEEMRREMLDRTARDRSLYCSADLSREKDWVTA